MKKLLIGFFLGLATVAYGTSYYAASGAYAYITTPVNTTTTVAGTYYRVEGTFSNELSRGFSIVGDLLTYLGVTRFFEIQVHGSFVTSIPNTEVSLALYKNGVLQVDSIMTGEIDTTADKMPISMIDVLELTDGDNVEIRIASDKAGAVIRAITMNTSVKPFFQY